jgi:serine/threonine protein kinase
VLEYLARLPQPLIHHDIKPANLIVRPDDGQLVLVDFGSAVLPESRSGSVRLDSYGTPGYAAPEQYNGSSSPASDIYGLGATLYHLLTDDDPCEHPLSFPRLDTLPPAVADALRPTLERDPAARPDARRFRAALQRLLPRMPRA